MRTAGVFLIFAAVLLRSFVVFSAAPQFILILSLLAVYGLLLLAETWLTDRKTMPEANAPSSPHGTRPPEKLGKPVLRAGVAIYFLLQSSLAFAMIITPSREDFFALLFIPLSLDAVTFFGRRNGYLWIAFFSLVLTGALLTSNEGLIFGLAMGALYTAMCFLFGGYAHQVQKAEMAHTKNQHMLSELQNAHGQLQGYADQLANLAVEQERNRLARDLHDSVTQTVFSMNLAAQSARLLLDKDPSRVSEQLHRLDELTTSALSEIQSLVSQLRPRSVADEGLSTALRRLASERGARDGLQVTLEISGEKQMSDVVAAGLYSIAHEALVNVAKHSGSHEATVRLQLKGDGSCLEIEDHGRGFDPQMALSQPGHLGLAGMSERAREIGWSLSVDSRPGQGTCIHVIEKQTEGQE